MSRVLNLLLTHQSAAEIGRMLDWWKQYTPVDQLLVAFNGPAATFQAIAHPAKIFVDDERLRTLAHSRERQSYTSVLRETAAWMQGRDFTHVLFAEYDQVPLIADFNARQLARLEEEHADILAFQLARVDGTNQPHFLYHAFLPGFWSHWANISVRAQKTVILSMFGSGTFWTREAFEAVAAMEEPFPVYLELYLPTLAHHLGYRLRDWGEQNQFISSLGDFADEVDEARKRGAWMLHPVKSLWSQAPIARARSSCDESTRSGPGPART
jgi:hypothetical protein